MKKRIDLTLIANGLNIVSIVLLSVCIALALMTATNMHNNPMADFFYFGGMASFGSAGVLHVIATRRSRKEAAYNAALEERPSKILCKLV